MFISFALGPPPRGTQSYASDLARRLRERDFTVFFSEDEAPPGEPLTPSLRAALHSSSVLVVVANRGTLVEPRWVRSEVEEFHDRHPDRPVIPISVDGALQDPSLATQTQAWLHHQEKIWLDESAHAVDDGIASEALVERLALAPTRVRSNVRWRWVVRGVIGGLAVLTATSIAGWVYATRQRDEAIRQNAIAQAGRLAAQADLLRERGGAVDASVMLAAEAVRTLTSIGERSLEVDLSLRRALTLLPQSHGEFDNTALKAQLSPAGDYVTFTGADERVSVRQLPGGEFRSCSAKDIEAPPSAEGKASVRLITAASTNGDWCVVREHDGANRATLEVWSARPPRRIDSLTVHSKAGHVHSAISDDGTVLAITDPAQSGQLSESTLRLWSRTSQSDLLRAEGDEFRAFSPDRRHFATAKGLWRLPDDARGAAVRVLPWQRVPYHFAFSGSGGHIATRDSHDGGIELWDVNAARLLRTSKAPEGEVLALSEGARFIIVAARDGTLAWDTHDETVRANVPREAQAAAFGLRDPILLVVETSPISVSRVRVLSFPRWGSALAGIELDANERVLWLGVRGEQVDLLVAADDAIRLETWAFRSGARTIVTSLPRAGPWSVSADGRRFAVATVGRVVVGPIGADGPTIEIPQTAAPQLVALNSDGSYLATAAAKVMRVRRLESREDWNSPPLPGSPIAIKVSRDGTFGIAVIVGDEMTRAGLRRTLMRWRLANAADTRSIDLGGDREPLKSLCFVSDDGRVMRWFGERREIDPGRAAPRSNATDDTECEAVITPRLRLVAEETLLVASDPRSRQPLARLDHRSGVQLSAAATDGKHVATLTNDREVRVFTLDAGELIAQTCARAPRPLTADAWKLLGATTLQDACGRTREGAGQ